MGVRVTDGETEFALFDSTTGLAFGPVFDNYDEAEGFLSWLREKELALDKFKFGNDEVFYVSDPRSYTTPELQQVVNHYLDEQEAEAQDNDIEEVDE